VNGHFIYVLAWFCT